MKKVLLFTVLGLIFLLGACRSLENYEETLEDAGWNVQITTVENLPDFIDQEEIAEDYIVGMMIAQQGANIGMIFEYSSRSNATEAYDNLVGSNVEMEDYVVQKGNFVFISYSETFFNDLNLK